VTPDSTIAGEAGEGQRLDYHALNAMLNLYDADGKIQFDMDRRAAREYFLQHVNQNTVFFHNLDEKLDYLVEKNYYEREVLDQYARNFVRELFDHAYAKKFRFPTFLGAFKYYTSYTLKTFDGKRYLDGGRPGAGTAVGRRDHRRPLPAGHAHVPQLGQEAARRARLVLPPAYRGQHGVDRPQHQLRPPAVQAGWRRGTAALEPP